MVKKGGENGFEAHFSVNTRIFERKGTLFLIMMLALAVPLGMMAQYFESGTSKTGSVSKNVHEVWYTTILLTILISSVVAWLRPVKNNESNGTE